MDRENTKDLTVVRKSIFDKIRGFFKKLFSKKEVDSIVEESKHEEIGEKEKTEESKDENSFVNDIKIEEDKEEKRLLKLQALIAEGIITEDELPEEDVKELHKLYDRQILDLKKSIDEYKEKILKLRMNMDN